MVAGTVLRVPISGPGTNLIDFREPTGDIGRGCTDELSTVYCIRRPRRGDGRFRWERAGSGSRRRHGRVRGLSWRDGFGPVGGVVIMRPQSSGGIQCACGGFGPWCIELRPVYRRLWRGMYRNIRHTRPEYPHSRQGCARHGVPRAAEPHSESPTRWPPARATHRFGGIRRPSRRVRALVRPRNPAERGFLIASTSGAGPSSPHLHRPRIHYALVWNPADSFAARYREIAADLVAADPPHTHPVLPHGQRVRQRRTAPRPIRRRQDLVTAVYAVFPARLRRWPVVRRSVRATT